MYKLFYYRVKIPVYHWVKFSKQRANLIVLTWQKDQALETRGLQSSVMWPAYVLLFIKLNSLS
jgi:hypothetical protein